MKWRAGYSADQRLKKPVYPLPVSDGIRCCKAGCWSLAGRGVGDQVLFAGLLAEAAERVAGITVTVDPRLVPLLPDPFLASRSSRSEPALEVSDFTAQCALGSLGSFSGATSNRLLDEEAAIFGPTLIGSRPSVARWGLFAAVDGPLLAQPRSADRRRKESPARDAGRALPQGGSLVDLQYGETHKSAGCSLSAAESMCFIASRSITTRILMGWPR
jgi:hypothetical protein